MFAQHFYFHFLTENSQYTVYNVKNSSEYKMLHCLENTKNLIRTVRGVSRDVHMWTGWVQLVREM